MCSGCRQAPSCSKHSMTRLCLRYLGDNACSADDRIDGICFGTDSESARAQSSEAGQQYWKTNAGVCYYAGVPFFCNEGGQCGWHT